MNHAQQMTHQTHINDSRHIPEVQCNKQSHTWTDPLADILNNINNNPEVYANAYTNSTNSHSAQHNHPTKNNKKER